jgi:branched-chain amino acid transport system permease protein
MIRVAGNWGVPFPIAPVVAAVLASAIAVIIALPALRIRGIQLAIVTLATAVAIDSMLFTNSNILSYSQGNNSVPPPSFAGLGFGINQRFLITRDGLPNPGFGLFVLVVAILGCALVVRLRSSSMGRLFLGVRSNEAACSAAGNNALLVKSVGFAISGFLAGLAGALSAYRFQGATAQSFMAFQSLSVFAAAYLGGIATVGGAIVGGFLVTGGLSTQVVKDVFNSPSIETLLAGIGLVLTAVLNPNGIVGGVAGQVRFVRSRFGRRRSSQATPTSALKEGASSASA